MMSICVECGMNNHPMKEHQFCFIYWDTNTIYSAKQFTSFLSSTSSTQKRNGKGDIQGKGHCLYYHNIDNIRRAVALFSIRSLPKHTWINSDNVFIGRVE